MSRRKKTLFGESAWKNNVTFMNYYDRLKELAISMFEWQGFPDSVDTRYLELSLFENGNAIVFNDEVLGMLALSNTQTGNFDIYGTPTRRRAFSGYNQYQKNLNSENSVFVWNNMLRTNSVSTIQNYALRLANLDRIIDVNANAQKTPVLIKCDEKERLSMMNLYKEYDGNAPFIFGDKSLNTNGVSVLSTNAPYVCDKIYELKTQYWNEALTYLGISNVSYQKKERMVSDEVLRNQGGTVASRYSRLYVRQKACDEINKMFGLHVSVDYREDFQLPEEEDEVVEDE